MNPSMKTTGRFAIIIGAILCAFMLLLILAPPAAAQHTGTGMMLPSSGGGMSAATADASYIRLDGVNTPATGAILFADGTQADPAIAFGSEPGMGFYYRGTNYLGLAIGGTRAWAMRQDPLDHSNDQNKFYANVYQFEDPVTTNRIDLYAENVTTGGPLIGTTDVDKPLIITNGGIDAAGEYGVLAGTTVALTTTNPFAVCIDCAAASPTYVTTVTGAGAVKAGAGSNALPTYSFLLDPDTGMYNVGANQLGLTAGGNVLAYMGGANGINFISPVPLTGAVERGFSLDVTQNLTAADFALYLNDNAGVSPTALFTVDGAGAATLAGGLTLPAGSAASKALVFSTMPAGAGFYTDGTYLFFGTGASGYRAAFTTSTTSAFIGGAGLAGNFDGGLIFTSGANTLNNAGLTFTTAQTTRAHVISQWTDANASLPAAGLGLWSAMDADGEYAVGIGTSAPATAGMILLSLVGDADGTPTRQINFMGDGRALAGAGTVGTPTYSFLADPNTGIYNSAADTLDFAAGGVRHGYVDANGITSVKASGGGFHGFVTSHAGSGTGQYTGFSANTNGTNYTEFYATGSTYTASDPYPQNGGVLSNSGPGGLNIASIHATTPAIRFMLDTPSTTIATIESTGFLPGTDNSFNLGSSTLSWSDIFTKYISDQAGVNRLQMSSDSSLILFATTTTTAGTDAGFTMNVTTDFAAADEALVLSDNTGTSAAKLFTVFGDGVVQTGAGGLKVTSTGTTITESNSASTGSVDFASISADTCGVKTITVTGADVNTPVACSWPAALEANLIGMCYVSAADTVTFRLCNMTAIAIDPASATFGARTIK